MGVGMVRVDRGDGRLFNFQPNDVDAFVKGNPGAKVVVGRPHEESPTDAEDAAARAQRATAATIPRMNLTELRAFAAEHDIDLDGATVKADIVERIEAEQE